MSALALALDPGGTTGYCYGYIDVHKLIVAPGERRMTMSDMFTVLEDVCHKDAGWHVIWETFEYRYHSRPGLDPTPIKLIGVIELFQEWNEPHMGFWPQTAAQGLGHYGDGLLKQLNLWHKGKGHSRSAMKHLLQWCTFGYGASILTSQRSYEMISEEEFHTTYGGNVPPRRGRQHVPCQ